MNYPIDTSGVPHDMVSRVSAAIDAATKSGLDWDEAVSRVAADTQARARFDGREVTEAIALGRFVHSAARILETDLAAEMVGQMISDALGCEVRIKHQSLELDERGIALVRYLKSQGRVSSLNAYIRYGMPRVVDMFQKDLITHAEPGWIVLSAMGRAIASMV